MNGKAASDIRDGFRERLDYNELMNCMRCGFCLPSCPTYGQEQYEGASPRGRIALMKGVVDGVIEPDADVERQLDLCLGCRACEPVCPSGVKYGHLLEEARDVIQSKKQHKLPVRLVRMFVFRGLFPRMKWMRRLHVAIYWYQKSGLQRLVRGARVLRALPGNLEQLERTLPDVPGPAALRSRPTALSAFGEPKMKVAFFRGCLMDTMFMETNDATMTLLRM